jgi:hypothetical protein
MNAIHEKTVFSYLFATPLGAIALALAFAAGSGLGCGGGCNGVGQTQPPDGAAAGGAEEGSGANARTLDQTLVGTPGRSARGAGR